MLARIVGIVVGALVWTSAAIAQPVPQVVRTEAGNLAVETWIGGLAGPWGAAFLPDGRLLVTEKRGTLRLVPEAGVIGKPIAGVPEVRNNFV